MGAANAGAVVDGGAGGGARAAAATRTGAGGAGRGGRAAGAPDGDGAASASCASSHPRDQFPEDAAYWKDSISTRHRFSEPGEDTRTSNGLEPREGTTPKT